MKKSLSLLVATTALTVAIGFPAFAAMRTSDDATTLCGAGVCVMELGDADLDLPVVRVDDDGDGDEDGGWFSRDDDDEDCEDDGEDEDDDDDDETCPDAVGNPAPAGTVPPPANGLFGNGTPPMAVTN